MSLRLQLENGEIKEYQTVRGVGTAIGGEVSGAINGSLNAEENGIKYPSPTKNAITWSVLSA